MYALFFYAGFLCEDKFSSGAAYYLNRRYAVYQTAGFSPTGPSLSSKHQVGSAKLSCTGFGLQIARGNKAGMVHIHPLDCRLSPVIFSCRLEFPGITSPLRNDASAASLSVRRRSNSQTFLLLFSNVPPTILVLRLIQLSAICLESPKRYIMDLWSRSDRHGEFVRSAKSEPWLQAGPRRIPISLQENLESGSTCGIRARLNSRTIVVGRFQGILQKADSEARA